MLHFSPYKTWSVIFVVVIGILFASPNLFSDKTLQGMPSWLPTNKLNQGLDLRGGSHLVLQMNEDELMADWLETVRDETRKKVAEVKVGGSRIRRTRPKVKGRTVVFKVQNPAHVDAVITKLGEIITQIPGSIFGASGGPNLEIIKGDNGVITIKPTEVAENQRLSSAISAAIETIRRRIDPNGTTEPLIQRNGRNRILVQVPGFNDPQKLKKLIGKTAKLTFHLLNNDVPPSAVETQGVPFDSELVRERESGQMLLLKKRAILTGDELDNVFPDIDSRTNRPVVAFQFNTQGARTFGEITRDNVGRRFAIVLDNGVDENGKRDRAILTAPVIQTAILGGSGIITGRFTPQETAELSLLIKSGSLPASLKVIEQQSVGATLGADSIAAGKIASVIGLVGVIVFMLVAYGLFGLFANIALMINLILIVAFLSLSTATLTLPGIAGIVLTIGMAVDANVLIFERIREELRAGKTVVAAIDTGYNRALGTILDANITTFIAAAILYALGSGPIQGFAVTLSIGIATSVFTAFLVTRLMVVTWLRMQNTRTVKAPI